MARMILDRVAATPDWTPDIPSVTAGSRLTGAASASGFAPSPPGCSRSALVPRTGWLSRPAPGWSGFADFVLRARAATTVYPTTPAAEVAYILRDSGARVVGEDDEQIAEHAPAEHPELLKVVSFDGAPDGDWVIGLEALEQSGRDRLLVRPTAVDDAVARSGPSGWPPSSTPGTTGPPEVRLVHDNWTYEGWAIQARGCCGRRRPVPASCRVAFFGKVLHRPSWPSGSPRPSTGASRSWSTTWR